MGDLVRVGAVASWGLAEQAALDRCLTVPGLREPAAPPRPPRHLSRIIEGEIIPRLMLAHRTEADSDTEDREPAVSAADVRDFTRLSLERDSTALLAHVAVIEERGLSLATIMLDLLSPTARLLGDMWREDLCTFTDVTIGLSRLQQVLREITLRFESDCEIGPKGRILLTAMPGDQHSFGVSMLESFFRRSGWDVVGGGAQSRPELLDIVRHEWLDVVGLSLSSDVFFDRLEPLIRTVRRASRNPSVFVMVGGRYFLDHPDLAKAAGADAAASDAPDALRRADERLGLNLARA